MDILNLTSSEKIKIEVLLEHELKHRQSEMLSVYRTGGNIENIKEKKKDCKTIYKIIDKIVDSRKS
ncbi:hypothetical protein IZY60_14040 [Lutibacter sp. B2]|nr:hypothetical protein [Lutibacter sp. B2]